RLLARRQRGIEHRQRDDGKAGHRDGEDAPRLAQPALGLGLAPRLLRAGRRRPRRRRGLVGLDGDGLRGHQTSRIIGSTTGLRWKRWLTNWRTAVRTRAPSASRSCGSSGARSARAATTAARSSPSSVSFSFTYTTPRVAISGPAIIVPCVSTV